MREEFQQLSTCGEKGNINFHMRLTNSQYERLKALAKASGFQNVSSFVRARCLDNLSHDIKLNKILELLTEKGDENGE